MRKIYEIRRQQSDIYSGKILEIFVYFGLFQEKGSTKCSEIFKEGIWVQLEHISVEIIYGGHSRSLCHFQNCVLCDLLSLTEKGIARQCHSSHG